MGAVVNQFNVSAFPSLITLGGEREKVHRFSGYKKPKDFLPFLEDALRRHALYRKGKKWDAPEPRPASICKEGTVETIPAPMEDVPSGITWQGRDLWIAQGDVLYQIEPGNGKVVGRIALPRSVRALCTDGKLIYGMEYGWTAGRPIHVIDPVARKVVRSIVTEANKKNRSMGASGIAWKDGKLYVLAGMRGIVSEVDPKTGEITRTLKTGLRWLSCLDYDGRRFVAGDRKALFLLDLEKGEVVRRIEMNYPLRALAAHGGAYYLMEQPIFGHDRQHQRIRVWPKRTLVHKLTLE